MIRRQQRAIAQQMQHDKDREDRDVQRRMDADLAQRNYERERTATETRIQYGNLWRGAPGGRISDDGLTAQSLINAIITENIKSPAESRERFVS